jgi:hypothetical protein
MKKELKNNKEEAQKAFTKIGVLMAAARRTNQALHPTNLHVNEALFPNDTVQSRMPEPGWLEHWLDKQIQFDKTWEGKVSGRILQNLGILLKQTFNSVQDLNKFRKSLASSVTQTSVAA